MNNYIKRFHDLEVWKEVELKGIFIEKMTVQISNYGKLKKITLSSGYETIVNQGKTEKYPSVSLRTLEPLTEKQSNAFNQMRLQIGLLEKENKENAKELKLLSENFDDSQYSQKYSDLSKKIEENTLLLQISKKKYKVKYLNCEKKRKKTWSALVHRLVAIYFVNQPSENHNLVAHIDYDKENNHHSNLKWMTREENTAHQKKNPNVINAKAKVLLNGGHRGNTKLTERDVMILKKRMNEGVSLRELSKRNKVTETQLLRIKRGINWGKVPAAL